jgi:hypothetical protein
MLLTLSPLVHINLPLSCLLLQDRVNLRMGLKRGFKLSALKEIGTR